MKFQFLWHMIRTEHRVRFDEETRAVTCDCGRVFYPVGHPRRVRFGPVEIRWNWS